MSDRPQPFLSKFPRNSSWEIASTLPALLPASPENPVPIHIQVHHEPVRVAYRNVVRLVPELLPPSLDRDTQPEVVLHIGLAAGRKFFAIEQGAHNRGYGDIPDVDGERYYDAIAEEEFPTDKFPKVLHTSFDTSDVLARWKENLGYPSVEEKEHGHGRADVQISQDAGNFLCGFIYYNSLAHYFSIKEDERPVAFLHVPDLSYSEEKLKEGREIAIALIKALVDSKRNNGVIDSGVKDVQEEREMDVDGKSGNQTDNNFA